MLSAIVHNSGNNERTNPKITCKPSSHRGQFNIIRHRTYTPLLTDFLDDLEDIETPQDKVTKIKEQIKAKQGIKANAKYTCTECGKEIQKSAYDYSTAKFGKALCYTCQQEAKKNVTATAELPQAEEGK